MTLTVAYGCKIFYMQKVRNSAIPGSAFVRTAVVVEAVHF